MEMTSLTENISDTKIFRREEGGGEIRSIIYCRYHSKNADNTGYIVHVMRGNGLLIDVMQRRILWKRGSWRPSKRMLNEIIEKNMTLFGEMKQRPE